MTNRNADSSQGEGGNNLPPPTMGAPPPDSNDNQGSRNGNKVYKSGPLFLSSRGIGWTSWKKRWFILTRTSLVFFRNDPSAIPQKGSEVNLTLGGIDLNSSLSVVVKADKKLLTVLFPDSRDGNGRAFTLKAETTEDLHEWKAALEEALANAPSAALVMGQNGIFKSDQNDAADGSLEQSKDRQPAKSMVIGRPILLVLEDIDGTPSFLEKALRFLEEHGVKVEGILRQAADVDDVEHRIREYEQGKTDFSAEEDPHVIADCIKYVLRELPSSPVPASCCNALLEACRTDRSMRVSAMRTAICDTFPEPNRRLLQRILVMMQAVAANKVENRMSISAVAACMAPLLLRPLLAGDCELEHTFDMGGDGSVQLLQAAAAANHAQAIVITLLEEYENLFGEGNMSTELYTDTEESGSESEELSDDGTYEDDEDGEDVSEGSDADMDEEIEGSSSCTCSETGDSADQNQHDNKGSESLSSHSDSHEIDDDLDLEANESISCSRQRSRQHTDVEVINDLPDRSKNSSTVRENEPVERVEDDNPEINSRALQPESIQRSITVANGPVQNSKRPTVWGRTGAKKNLSMENIDIPIEDEAEIERLEDMKINLQNKIAAEKKENAVLQEDLENRKNALHKRRLALEQDVAKLQEQLQKEKELRAALEAGLKMPRGPASISASIDERTKADLEEIAQAEADIISLKQKTEYLEMQVTQQREQNSVYVLESSNQPQQTSNQGRVKEKEKDFESSVSSRIEKSMRPKDTQVSKTQTEKDAKNQPPSLLSKPSAQNQQSDSLRNPKSAVTQAALALMEQGGIDKSSTTNSRRSGPRGEVGPTSSALTKLTNRLNFLKERRNQIANELQTMDKGRNSGQAAQKQDRSSTQSETLPSNVSVDKFKESEGQSSEKGRAGSESNQYQQNIDRGGGVTQGSSFQNADTNRKVDMGSKPEDQGQGQSTSNLDREKSESFPNNEKSRSVVPPRTFSR